MAGVICSINEIGETVLLAHPQVAGPAGGCQGCSQKDEAGLDRHSVLGASVRVGEENWGQLAGGARRGDGSSPEAGLQQGEALFGAFALRADFPPDATYHLRVQRRPMLDISAHGHAISSSKSASYETQLVQCPQPI